MTEALAGPYCAMLLGDFGADVIKVERPGSGNQSRNWGPPFVGSESAYYLAANRNKRSITLNYDHPRGTEALQKLLATADVFIANQPSLASLQKRGIDPDSLRAKFPRLIYCSITGYGFTGPKAGMPGYDILAQAEAGVMSFTGEPGGEPMRYPIAIADMTCGMYAAMGILAALFAREKNRAGTIHRHGAIRFATDMAGERWEQLPERGRFTRALGECPSEDRAVRSVPRKR